MKKLLLAASLIIGGSTLTTALPTTTLEASAKTISKSAIKQYAPSTKYTYTYKVKYQGKTKKHTRKYQYGVFTSSSSEEGSLNYTTSNNQFSIWSGEVPIVILNGPFKVGKTTTYRDLDGTEKFKILSTKKKVKVAGKSYKNVLVVKNTHTKVTFYIAKNRGIILMKNKSWNLREELIKISKR